MNRILRTIRPFFCASRPISWRRLVVFLIATGLLLAGMVSEQTWVMLAVAYIGGETLQRLAATAYAAPAVPDQPELPRES